jgi:hypothetical protein
MLAMTEPTRTSMRRIFLHPRPHVVLMTAADLPGMPFPVLKHEIAEGTIVAVSVGAVGLAGVEGGADRGGTGRVKSEE